jgi:hypothetical protein
MNKWINVFKCFRVRVFMLGEKKLLIMEALDFGQNRV